MNAKVQRASQISVQRLMADRKKCKASSINQSTIKLFHECYYCVMLAMDIYFWQPKPTDYMS
jgi:hypothetical protein